MDNSSGKVGSRRGYTLLEMAVVMSVVGIVLASFIGAYEVYLKNKTRQLTLQRSERIVQALSAFLIRKGRYPCPARYTDKRGDATYGLEADCTGHLSGLYGLAPAVGTCTGGLCYEKSERTTNINPDNTAPVIVTPEIVRGSVPFRTLGLQEDDAEDGYGRRFWLSMTGTLADALTYRNNGGGAHIVDELASTMITPNASAHFVLVSAGPDGAGAYTRQGQLYKNCSPSYTTPATPGQTWDSINCDIAPSAVPLLARYRVMEKSVKSPGPPSSFYYDDYVRFYSTVETPLWTVADLGGFHIRDLEGISGPNNVGVSATTPSNPLHVAGNMRVRGVSNTSELCKANGTDCFAVSSIGGDDPEMQCENPLKSDYDPAKKYVVAIGSRKVSCTDVVEIRCPAGQIVTGIDAAGTLICATVTGCAPTPVDTCFNSGTGDYDQVVLPSGVEGQSYTTPVAGVSKRFTYQCLAGIWTFISETGLCTCNAVNETVSGSCDSSLPGNWTGGTSQTHTVTCPAGTETWGTLDTSACVCTNGSETRHRNCPGGLTGDIYDQRDWTCTSATTGSWSAWTEISNTCVCVPDTQTRTIGCPTGYSGSGVVQENTLQCPAGTWTGWVDVSSSCVCSGSVQSRTLPCPAGQVGLIEQERNFNCTTNDWDTWVTINNYCGPVTYQWVPKAPQSGTSPTPFPDVCGTPCSTVGAMTACTLPSGGSYSIYPSARCE